MSDYPYTDKAHHKPSQENPTDQSIGKVRLLTDTNDDGVFDKATIFAADLSWPTGAACWKGGIIVVATPDIWYLKDTDGDGVADVRQKLFTGLKKLNVQAVANNPIWGLDNKIYIAGGSNGGSHPEPRPSRGTTAHRAPRRSPARSRDHEAGTHQRRRALRQHARRLGQPLPLQHPQSRAARRHRPQVSRAQSLPARPSIRCTTPPKPATSFPSTASARRKPGANCAPSAGAPKAPRCPAANSWAAVSSPPPAASPATAATPTPKSFAATSSSPMSPRTSSTD